MTVRAAERFGPILPRPGSIRTQAPGRGATRLTRLALGLSLVTAQFLSAEASAQTQPTEGHPDPLSPQDLFAQVRQHYEQGQLPEALEVLRQGCDTAQYEGCEYNLGVIEQALEHCPEATSHYRRYLEHHPDGSHRPQSTQALSYLSTLCEVPEATQSAAPTARAPALSSQPTSAPPPAIPPATSPAAPEPVRTPTLVPHVTAPGFAPMTLYALGGVAGAIAAYGGTRLVLSNRAIQRHKDSPSNGLQDTRFNRASQYRTLTVASGATTLLCVGAAFALQWPFASDTRSGTWTVGLQPSTNNRSARLIVAGAF